MSTHPLGPSGQPPDVPTKVTPRKPLAKRLFSGMAGSPLARLDEAQKPVQAPPATAEPQKSTSARRAARWREKQKQESSFESNEAERKRRKREQDKQDPTKWSDKHRGFPLSLEALRQQDKYGGLYMKGAPRGKGKIVVYGGGVATEVKSGIRTADAWQAELPRRAQLSDSELLKRLRSGDDLQSKIDSIVEHWEHDKKFCEWLNELSLEEITEFVQFCSENLDATRWLLYDKTEHQALAQVASNLLPNAPALTTAQPHGRQVEPKGVGDDHQEDLPKQTEHTFTRRISFKKADIQTLRIGNRNVKFYNLQNGSAEEHFEQFLEENTGEGVCQLCQQEITPSHFENEHRQEVIEAIRWHEAKAWRPKKRACAQEEHARLARVYGGGKQGVKCKKCGKLVYKPPKPKRSDAAKILAAGQVAAD
jgi:hypothetical protein